MEPLSQSNKDYTINYWAIAQTLLPATLLTAATAYIACVAKGRSLSNLVVPLNGKLQPTLAMTALAVSYLVLCKLFAGPLRIEVIASVPDGKSNNQLNEHPEVVTDETGEPGQQVVVYGEPTPKNTRQNLTEILGKQLYTFLVQQRAAHPTLSSTRIAPMEQPFGVTERNGGQQLDGTVRPIVSILRTFKIQSATQIEEKPSTDKVISALDREKCIEELKKVDWGVVDRVFVSVPSASTTTTVDEMQYALSQGQVSILLILLDIKNPGFSAACDKACEEVNQNVLLVWEILKPKEQEMQVEAGKHSEDMCGSFVMVPEESAVPSSPGVYNDQIHGPNGIHMKQMQYRALLNEYRRCFKKAYEASIEEALQKEGLNEKVKELLKLLVVDETTDLQKRYKLFCQSHREIIESYQGKEDQTDKEVIKISRALARARFMANIQAFQNAYVREHMKEMPPLKAETFHEQISIQNQAVNTADEKMKISGASLPWIKLNGELSLANYFEVNPPNLRNKEVWENKKKETRTIYHLRHSTPNAYWKLDKDSSWYQNTRDLAAAAMPGVTYHTIIDPAYTEFLRFAEEKDEGVLYACHQKMMDTNEGKRSAKIIELEKNHPNLLLLFQSVEFPLFMQGAKTFAALKKELIDSFYKGEWNRLPLKLQKDNAYKKEMELIFDFVHKTFFKNKTTIDQTGHQLYPDLKDKEKYAATEGQAFLMLFYHYQRENLKFYDKISEYKFNVTYVNTGCKDNFDRGFNNNCTTDRIHQTGLYRKKVPSELLKATATSGMAVTLHGKGIGILGYRLHPALLVSKLLSEMSEKDQAKILRLENGWKLAGCGLPLKKNQSATA